jgi:predicted nucleic acid-binding protein
MVILDTNVLSELMRQHPERRVAIWLDQQAEVSIWTTSVNIFEIRSAIEILPDGRRRALLETEFERLIDEDIQRRVVSFDTAAAAQAASLMAASQRAGRPSELRDTMIAGIVLANHATLATRNTRHFADLMVPVTNPWGE